MTFIYLPEAEHIELLVDTHSPDRSAPAAGPRWWDWYYGCQRLLEGGYLAMQAHAHRMESDRRLSYDDVMDCLKGRAWALRALLAPLPDRPPLLHTGCERCPFEGCSNCLGDKCLCSTGKQSADRAYRICLNR